MTVVQAENAGLAGKQAADRWPFMPYFLACLLVVYFFIAFDLVDGKLFSGDTDDLLRKLQVKRFVEGAGWFDLSVPSVQMPEVYIAPWSRLVDLPYSLIAWALTPFVGSDRALGAAFLIWPPIMAAFYALGVVGVLCSLVPARRDLPLALMLALLLPATFAIWEFSPGRVDHHNVQILLLLSLVYGLSRWDRFGGAIAGAAVTGSMVIGLESLPVLAGAVVAVCGAWVLNATGSGRVLTAFGLSAGLMAIALSMALIAPSDYFVMHGDVFSASYVLALIGFGIVVATLVNLMQLPTIAARAASLVIGGLIVIGAILWLYPAMLDGPLPMIRGLAKTYWFDRIDQEKSALSFFATSDERAILHLLMAICIVLLSLPAVIQSLRERKPILPVVFVVILAALLAACVSARFLRIALGIVSLLFPVAVGVLGATVVASRTKALLIGACIVLFAGAGIRMFVLPPAQRTYDAFDYLIMNDCRDYSFAKVAALPAGRMMTPPALGLQIIAHDPGAVSVSSISFHRASAAMSDVLAVMMGQTAAENASLLKQFDYLGICRTPGGMTGEEKLPLYVSLLSGRPVLGLVEITGPRDALMIFRVDHETLQ